MSTQKSRHLFSHTASIVTSILYLPLPQPLLITGDRDEKILAHSFPQSYSLERCMLKHKVYVTCLSAFTSTPSSSSSTPPTPLIVSGDGEGRVVMWSDYGKCVKWEWTDDTQLPISALAAISDGGAIIARDGKEEIVRLGPEGEVLGEIKGVGGVLGIEGLKDNRVAVLRSEEPYLTVVSGEGVVGKDILRGWDVGEVGRRTLCDLATTAPPGGEDGGGGKEEKGGKVKDGGGSNTAFVKAKKRVIVKGRMNDKGGEKAKRQKVEEEE
ncbi:hypothetical protein TrCOL_g7310 [Triparma columacea]|uniref:Uncharacterized protein n=1 Tax=Triparma columacea TaxID=722753 RepID=A0A9W7FYD8_9STRA|nr:hypothetical protein TrCOL_g7310 [Triparma columacea]